MTWDALAAIGRLIGAVGVIASLVFVGIQLRQIVTCNAGAIHTRRSGLSRTF
jgi:hypothetical protein